ncbi:MAG: hypothetical protein J0I65_06745 [Variovorax sp.]|nr:hypothetical protein [Variovorax sp.]|tara:strand:- start:1988 stop:2188 length:201 start_codon:yes stop_codon:yes gene_type:complete
MSFLKLLACAMVLLGIWIGSRRIELCSHRCLLEVLGDALLPTQLEFASGGVLFVVAGLILWWADRR